MSGLAPLARVVFGLVARSPVVLAVCFLCLAAGLVEASLMQALQAGLSRQLRYDGLADVQIVLRSGAASEQASSLDADEVARLNALCGAHACAVSPQVVASAVSDRPGRPPGAILVRGVNDLAGVPGVRFVRIAGRSPEPGRDELLAGEALLRAEGLAVGDGLRIDGRKFRIVGTFRAVGAPLDREALAYAERLQSSARPGYSSAWIAGRGGMAAALPSEAVREELQGSAQSLPAADLYARQFRGLRTYVDRLVWVVSTIVCLFALAAFAVSLGGVVRRAAPSLHILHVLGFTRGQTVVGVALVGAALGALAGATAAAASGLLLGGRAVTLPAGFQSVTLVLDGSPTMLLLGAMATTLLAAGAAAAAGWTVMREGGR